MRKPHQDEKENNIEDCNHSPLGFHVLCNASPIQNSLRKGFIRDKPWKIRENKHM